MIPAIPVLELEHALGLLKGRRGGGKKVLGLLQMSIWCVTMGASESESANRCFNPPVSPVSTGECCVTPLVLCCAALRNWIIGISQSPHLV